VPLNEQLADVTDLNDATEARAEFESDWNMLNLLRTLAVVPSFASVATAASSPSGWRAAGDHPSDVAEPISASG